MALTWEHVIPIPVAGREQYGGARPFPRARGGVLSPCRRWRCPGCGPGKRAEALKLIRAGTQTGITRRPGQPLRLITLTYAGNVSRSFDRREDVISSSEDWRRLVQTWRRSGRELEYVRVLERTRRGRIHIHAITWGDFIPKCTNAGRRARGLPTGPGSGSPCYCSAERPCIQQMAWWAGFGWVEVRAIRSPRQAAAYVAKYLGKQSADDWPRYARRVAYSRRFADGLTLGSIHSAWVADVRSRLAELGHLEEIPAGALWRHHRPGELSGTRAPPRPWLAR